MRYTILLNKVNTPNVEQINLGGFEGFDDFQTALIGIVTTKKAHASVFNARGNEVFEMRYSPSCSEGVCCTWQDTARLNRFIKNF